MRSWLPSRTSLFPPQSHPLMLTAHLLAPPAPTGRVTDTDITATIVALLATKGGLTAHLITVHTRQGIVELTGFTDNLLTRQRADEIALAVRGVRGLHSTLAVRTAGLPDAELQHAVARALANDQAIGGDLMQGVRWVRCCEAERLMIRRCASRNSDKEITTQVRERLDWHIRMNGALVVVLANKHIEYLSSTVGTATVKNSLMAISYQTGTIRVDTRDLFVAYWALGREFRSERFTPKTDAAIRAAVRATLQFNPRVRSTETLVQVLDGVVTLAGTVSNLRTRLDAEHDARHVVGVINVHNMLKVRPALLVSDESIRLTIAAALDRDPYVGHLVLDVQVHGGQALLTGLVTTLFELEHAGEVAAGASGVLDVNNRLEVAMAVTRTRYLLPNSVSEDADPTSLNPDLALAACIRARYCWSAELHGQEVTVQMSNGHATLIGTVDTWLDHKLAAKEAYDASAKKVKPTAGASRHSTSLPPNADWI